MPTGYTHNIKDGISFNDFVMQCARAMGACIMMRDDPAGTPIPEEFQPSTYNKDALEVAKSDLAILATMTVEQAEVNAKSDYAKDLERTETAIAEATDLREKYQEMLSAINAWTPPTPSHEYFKEFMQQQITSSIEHDCNISYYTDKEVKLLTGQEWIEKRRVKLLHDIDYHSKAWGEEVDRTNGRNAWIKALRESLKAA